MNKRYFVYIISNKFNTTIYIGVTNNLERRMFEHKNKLIKGFSQKYNLNKLLYYEETNEINTAIYREKQLKSWNRRWKLELIIKENPKLEDISYDWFRNEIPGQAWNDNTGRRKV